MTDARVVYHPGETDQTEVPAPESLVAAPSAITFWRHAREPWHVVDRESPRLQAPCGRIAPDSDRLELQVSRPGPPRCSSCFGRL